MAEYTKHWLSVDEQIDKLESRGVEVGPRTKAVTLLRSIGYYRLTGYLYPFRESERREDDKGKTFTKVLEHYRPGTSFKHAAHIVDFDRRLRMLVLDGVERIEVSLRTQVAYVLGKKSPFAHEEPSTFIDSFTTPSGKETLSKHVEWLNLVDKRRKSSDEAFVAHFREKYGGRMPIWVLTEILEMGRLSQLYAGLNRTLAEEIATIFGSPDKKTMRSWIASLNYVRNVAAHHARLFNRNLVAAPRRPGTGKVPLLDHLRTGPSTGNNETKAFFGVYNALAIVTFLLRSIDAECDWSTRLIELVKTFPAAPGFTTDSMGIPKRWTELELWRH